MDNFNVYKDIQARTKGEIYIGVVGPVRTGKSTFIKRFMELAVLPAMEDGSLKAPETAFPVFSVPARSSLPPEHNSPVSTPRNCRPP